MKRVSVFNAALGVGREDDIRAMIGDDRKLQPVLNSSSETGRLEKS